MPEPHHRRKFQSRCRDWVVGEWGRLLRKLLVPLFQSRCRDWVVGEHGFNPNSAQLFKFQSRCRDWVVGESVEVLCRLWRK